MSLSAKLQLGDNNTELYNSEYSVVECRYEMSKHYDRSSRSIDTETHSARIELTVVAPQCGDFTLYNWYIELMVLSGRVVIDLSSVEFSQNESSCKTLAFESAYCIGISERYDIGTLSRRELTLKILAKRLIVDMVDLNVMVSR